MRKASCACGIAALLVAKTAVSATTTVGPSDDYTKIEAAQAGDTVLVQPGTYKFRVYLDGTGTSAAPITIRASDPGNPPVWDLGGKPVNQWPGSYTGGDNDRGCWQVVGAYYVIESIVLQNCRNGINAAGIRTHATTALRVRDVVIKNSDDGFTGDGDDTIVEYSDIGNNGDPNASQETHNIYIYGGTFTLRYSYLHDSTHGQNFHIRAAKALLEYNWIARAQNYEGDMMSSDPAGTQEMTLRGNVIVGNATPENRGMILAMFNDNAGVTGYTFRLTAIWNTIVARTPTNPVVVNVGNTTLDAASVTLSNNILAGTNAIVAVSDAGVANTTVSGAHNFLESGATAAGLTASVTGADPGFRDAGNLDFTLGSGSACIGGADTTVVGAPDREYFQNEIVKERYRLRLSAADIGAFEHDTAGGSFGIREAPEGGAGGSVIAGDSSAGGAPGTGGRGGGTAAGDAGPSSDGAPASEEGGCGCRQAGRGGAWPLLLVGLTAFIARRTRRALARGTPCRSPCPARGSCPPSIRSTR